MVLPFGVATRFLVLRQALAFGCHDKALGVAIGQASWACRDRARAGRARAHDRAPWCVIAHSAKLARSVRATPHAVCWHYTHDLTCYSALCCALFGSLFIDTVLKKKKVQN